MATWPGWEGNVLARIGAPVTKQNIAFLDTWQRYEGGSAANNPLNTTQTASGTTDYNSVGVKNYPSPTIGAAATAATITNGRYNNVLAALRSGNPQQAVVSKGATLASELRTWGTTGFANIVQLGQVGSITVGSNPPPKGLAGVAADAGSAAQHIPGVVQVQSIGDFLGHLTDPSYLLRGLQIVAGGVLVLVGVVLLARQVGLAVAQTDIAKDAVGVAQAVPVVGTAAKASKAAGAATAAKTARSSARESRAAEYHTARVKTEQARATELRTRTRHRAQLARRTKAEREAAERSAYIRGAADQEGFPRAV